ncbi:HAMP domain-containing protein [Pseudomonas jessenii]|uniref:HAMP domain-containing protein n=1 Tax=Pseudomonas jessenii TaxID=77298 RepID=UPI0038917862
MGWFRDAGLTTKLTLAFGCCALITLAAVTVGWQGINEVSKYFKSILTNSEMSDAADDVRTSIAEQNRDLYRLLVSAIVDSSSSGRAEILHSIKSNRDLGEVAFDLYIASPLLEGNHSAGELNAKAWPAYQSSVDRFIGLLNSKDIEGAKKLIDSEMQPYYQRVVDELKVIQLSKREQLVENIDDGNAQVHHSMRALVVINVFALIVALVFGVLLARMINQPLAKAIRAAQRIQSGDLTKPIISTRQDEPGQLLRAMNLMQNRLKDDIQQVALTSDKIITVANKVSDQVRKIEKASSRLSHDAKN